MYNRELLVFCCYITCLTHTDPFQRVCSWNLSELLTTSSFLVCQWILHLTLATWIIIICNWGLAFWTRIFMKAILEKLHPAFLFWIFSFALSSFRFCWFHCMGCRNKGSTSRLIHLFITFFLVFFSFVVYVEQNIILRFFLTIFQSRLFKALCHTIEQQFSSYFNMLLSKILIQPFSMLGIHPVIFKLIETLIHVISRE